jgi:hypothetical protein
MSERVKRIITREASILLVFVCTGYILQLIYVAFHKGPLGPPHSFWKDPYFYQFWKNSLRENAQLIRFLGYPIFLLVRFIVWATKPFIKEILNRKKTEEINARYSEMKTTEILETIMKEINLNKKIESVTYRDKYFWYVVRFDSPPSCIIPQKHIDDYINSKGQVGKKEIIHFLLGGT